MKQREMVEDKAANEARDIYIYQSSREDLDHPGISIHVSLRYDKSFKAPFQQMVTISCIKS